MMSASSRSTSTSARRCSRYVVEARCASWVHSARGSVRARRPSPICSISASETKKRGRYSAIWGTRHCEERSDAAIQPRVTGLLRYARNDGLGRSWLALLLHLLRLHRSRLAHALVHLVRELREILDEQIDELCRRAVVLSRIGPGAARVEDRRVDARHFDRHVETEVRVFAEPGVLQRAVERSLEQSTRFLDRHALAGAVLAAGPAGVDQPAIDPAFGDPLLEQIAVDR